MVSRGRAPSDKPSGKWPSKRDKSVMKTYKDAMFMYYIFFRMFIDSGAKLEVKPYKV